MASVAVKLTELPPSLGLAVVRPGDFESLGWFIHDTPRRLTFIEDEKYLGDLASSTDVTCVIATAALAARVPPSLGVATAASPRAGFYKLHNWLADGDFYWKSFATEIAKTARVHPRAYVAERDVRIGERCVVEPNATILERSILADDVVVRAGTVVGSEGFQFAAVGDEVIAVRHVGGVRLERGVEIQSNACVDCALFSGFTVIGEDTKVDNLVHIAHGVRLGKRNRVVAGAMVAGSVVTGDDVWIGPMSSVADRLSIGDRAAVSLGAVVTRDVTRGSRVSGNFAIDHARFIAHMKAIR